MSFEIIIGKKHNCAIPMCWYWKVLVDGKNIIFQNNEDLWYDSEIDLEIGAWVSCLSEILAEEKCKIDFTDDPHYMNFYKVKNVIYIEVEINSPIYPEINGRTKTEWVTHIIKAIVPMDIFVKELLRVGESIYSVAKENNMGNKLESGKLYIEEALERANTAISEK